jgi:hypothetical protein
MNLPDGFGYLLLVLGLILTLAPWFNGLDFGVLKVPDFAPRARRTLTVAGPLVLLAAIGLHLPLPAAGPAPGTSRPDAVSVAPATQAPIVPAAEAPAAPAAVAAADPAPPAGAATGAAPCPDGADCACVSPQRPRDPGAAAPAAERRLAALAERGIDYSVDEADLASWLVNAEYTSYPAIADALVALAGDRRLRCPAFLDVIVWYYVETPGVGLTRTTADVRGDVLEGALLGCYSDPAAARRVRECP